MSKRRSLESASGSNHENMATLAPPVIKPEDKAAYEAKPMVDGRKIRESSPLLTFAAFCRCQFLPPCPVSAR